MKNGQDAKKKKKKCRFLPEAAFQISYLQQNFPEFYTCNRYLQSIASTIFHEYL